MSSEEYGASGRISAGGRFLGGVGADIIPPLFFATPPNYTRVEVAPSLGVASFWLHAQYAQSNLRRRRYVL